MFIRLGDGIWNDIVGLGFSLFVCLVCVSYFKWFLVFLLEEENVFIYFCLFNRGRIWFISKIFFFFGERRLNIGLLFRN